MNIWNTDTAKVKGEKPSIFRAVAQSLFNGQLTVEAETKHALNMRQRVIGALLDERHTLFLGETLEALVMQFPPINVTTYEGYIDYINKGGYGGEIELLLLSRTMRLGIGVFDHAIYETLDLRTTYTPGSGQIVEHLVCLSKKQQRYLPLVPCFIPDLKVGMKADDFPFAHGHFVGHPTMRRLRGISGSPRFPPNLMWPAVATQLSQ